MWLSEAFDRSFQSLKTSYGTWFLLAVITTILSLPILFASPGQALQLPEVNTPLFWSTLLALVLNIMIGPGLLATGITAAQGKPVTLELITKKVPLTLKLLGFYVIYLIAITAGLLALIIPGIYLMLRFGLAQFIIVNKENVGVFEAMQESGTLMKGQYFRVLFNFLVIWAFLLFIMMISAIILTLISGGDSTSWLLLDQALQLFPLSVFMAIFYTASAVIYLNLAKTKGKAKKA